MVNIKIFYLTYCLHSLKALETLKNNNIEHNAIITDNTKNEVVKNNSIINNNYRYFPQIFYNDSFVGGNDKLQYILNTLKNNDIPNKPTEWKRRSWLAFLNEISNKL